MADAAVPPHNDLSSVALRMQCKALRDTLSEERVQEILLANGSSADRLPDDHAQKLELLDNLIDQFELAAQQALQAARYRQPAVHYDFDVNAGQALPQEILENFVDQWPSVDEPWESKLRNKEMRQFPFPSNFMPDRRSKGMPDVAVGPWRDLIKQAPQGQHVVKADKHAASTQKAIEDSFRPYFSVLDSCVQLDQGGDIDTAKLLDDMHYLGKSIMNASAFCERNRLKSVLAILKPGADDELDSHMKAPLMQQHGVDALQRIRDTEKLASKMGIGKPKPASRGRGNNRRGAYQQGNSRSGAAAIAPTAAPGTQDGAARGKGKGYRGRGRGRN